jgi:hypothetical protein
MAEEIQFEAVLSKRCVDQSFGWLWVILLPVHLHSTSERNVLATTGLKLWLTMSPTSPSNPNPNTKHYQQ